MFDILHFFSLENNIFAETLRVDRFACWPGGGATAEVQTPPEWPDLDSKSRRL